jgi:hypothetical protein
LLSARAVTRSDQPPVPWFMILVAAHVTVSRMAGNVCGAIAVVAQRCVLWICGYKTSQSVLQVNRLYSFGRRGGRGATHASGVHCQIIVSGGAGGLCLYEPFAVGWCRVKYIIPSAVGAFLFVKGETPDAEVGLRQFRRRWALPCALCRIYCKIDLLRINTRR